MNHFSKDTRTALQAKEYAQWIAFAPIVFQASRILRDSGILLAIRKAGKKGITLNELVKNTSLSNYGVRVLIEAGLGIGLVLVNEEKYTLTNTGVIMITDSLTRVNMDFTNDICYEGLMDLEKSIKTGKPEGLKVFGKWNTIYEALSTLPEPAKKSWFDFDHYYSDSAFEDAMKIVVKNKPLKMLDIGGNTGKGAIACTTLDPHVHVTILDLPGQTAMAKQNINARGLDQRIGFIESNILSESTVIPGKYDAIWMSQFLDCFSDEQIISILKKASAALDDKGCIYILETFWDRQRFEASAFCLQMTSLYFTSMANGNSQMYDSKVFFNLVKEAGLELMDVTNNIGVSHTLLKCKRI